jgi:hypothetical protein
MPPSLLTVHNRVHMFHIQTSVLHHATSFTPGGAEHIWVKRNKIIFMKEQTVDWSPGMLAIIQLKILHVCILAKNLNIKLYKWITSPAVFMVVKLGISMKENINWRSLKNRVLRKIFEPKKHKVTADEKTWRNEKLQNLYSTHSTKYD